MSIRCADVHRICYHHCVAGFMQRLLTCWAFADQTSQQQRSAQMSLRRGAGRQTTLQQPQLRCVPPAVELPCPRML